MSQTIYKFTFISFASNHFTFHFKNKFTFISIFQTHLSIRNSSLRNFFNVNFNHHDNRRVTFDENVHSTHRFRFRNLVNVIDSIIFLNNKINHLKNTTTTLECLFQRLRISKSSQRVSSKQKIEKFIREIEYLRQKLTYYKNTRATYMKFFDITKQSQQNLHNALAKMSRRVVIFEQRFENY